MVYMKSILIFTTLVVVTQSAPLPSSVPLPQPSVAVAKQGGLPSTSNKFFIPGSINLQKDTGPTIADDGPEQTLQEKISFRRNAEPLPIPFVDGTVYHASSFSDIVRRNAEPLPMPLIPEAGGFVPPAK